MVTLKKGYLYTSCVFLAIVSILPESLPEDDADREEESKSSNRSKGDADFRRPCWYGGM